MISAASSNGLTYLARTNHRNTNVPFGIKQTDRRSHLYICGKTGTGKSHLLGIIFRQDCRAMQGCALLDPHGDLASRARTWIPEPSASRLVIFDAWDRDQPWRLNPFANVAEEFRALAAEGLVEVFKKLWIDEWGPRLEHILRNVAHTLIATPDATIASISPLLTDKDYRSGIVAELQDPIVRAFWTNEYEKYSPAFRAVAIAPLQNKVGAMMTNPVIRNILTEPGRQLDFRAILDEGGILVANLDKGRIGEATCSLLGSLILSQIALAGVGRSSTPEEARRDFWVCADECQLFTTLSIATMLSELRKYHVGLTLANQHLSQLDPNIRDAILGNAGTMISFRVGATDASVLAKEMGGRFSPADFTGLPRHHVYIRLLIDGQVSNPFSATTLSESALDDVRGRV